MCTTPSGGGGVRRDPAELDLAEAAQPLLEQHGPDGRRGAGKGAPQVFATLDRVVKMDIGYTICPFKRTPSVQKIRQFESTKDD